MSPGTHVRIVLLAAALLPGVALAQSPRGAPSAAQAERNAVELKQGMSVQEVQKLLGKPRRTALRAGPQGQAALQWTYLWSGPASSSAPDRSLQVEFAAKDPEQWTVQGWSWSSY